MKRLVICSMGKLHADSSASDSVYYLSFCVIANSSEDVGACSMLEPLSFPPRFDLSPSCGQLPGGRNAQKWANPQLHVV